MDNDLPSNAQRPLVSIALPTRNGARSVETAIRSVLAQDYEQIQLIVSDNASTDETERICREVSASDSRVLYHRHPENVGLLNNFLYAMSLAKGEFFRFIGDDDWLAPNYVSRCMQEFAKDSRLLLVTTQLSYVRKDASSFSIPFTDRTMYSDDPIVRYEKLISYLIEDALPVDPLYALTRRASLAAIPRKNVFREDEIFASKLALTGPWGHVPEVLGRQTQRIQGHGLARYLSVPRWQAHVPTIVQCWEMLRFIGTQKLTSSQRYRARMAIGRLFAHKHYRTLVRRSRRLAGLALPQPGSRQGNS